MNVRLATVYDLPQVYALAEAAYGESRYRRHPLRREKFERLAELAEQQPDAVLLLVAEHGDSIVGFMCGIVTEHYFADMIYATNLALYVAPAARGSRACLIMIRQFEREARRRGAAEVMLGVTSGVHPERTARLYNALGYETVGALTVKYIGG